MEHSGAPVPGFCGHVNSLSLMHIKNAMGGVGSGEMEFGLGGGLEGWRSDQNIKRSPELRERKKNQFSTLTNASSSVFWYW